MKIHSLTMKHISLVTTLLALASASPGQTFNVIHSFGSGTGGGGRPETTMVLSGNTLYGTTLYGGGPGIGGVFKVNTDGTGFALLHSFGDYVWGSPNGLILSGSTLYGTTPY